MLEHDLDSFTKFDLEKGYAIMEDHSSFIEALNQLYSEQRLELYNAITSQGHQKFFSRYLRRSLNVRLRRTQYDSNDIDSDDEYSEDS